MIIQYQSKKSDIISFYAYYYFIKRIRLVSIAWMIFGGLIDGCQSKAFADSEFFHRFMSGAFIAYVILFVVPFCIAVWKLLKDSTLFPHNTKISIIERGIITESLDHYRLIKWLDILTAGKTSRSVFVIYDSKEFVIIPKKYFATSADIETFLSTTKSKIVKSDPLRFDRSGRGSHLYKRGWWGLFPFIGGFVGLALLILGIFEYKDRKLIRIGAAGFLFSVLIYVAIIYAVNYSDSGVDSFVMMDQMMLKTLVKDIEFYKVEKGTYPDNLYQLSKQDNSAFIEDPLVNRGVIGQAHNFFNYKKIGDKYTVFSSGIDRIPNTADDIYPEISDSGSDKIGLIVR